MNTKERIFYFIVITIEVIIIILLNIKFKEVKKKIYYQGSRREVTRLFSFYGEDKNGDKHLIHFKNYSKDFYIFVCFSSECSKCDPVINEFQQFYEYRELNENTKLFFITADDFKKNIYSDSFNYLKLSRQDIFQFGYFIPTIFVVNGKGEVIYKKKGFEYSIFNKISEIINTHKYRRSEIITNESDS